MSCSQIALPWDISMSSCHESQTNICSTICHKGGKCKTNNPSNTNTKSNILNCSRVELLIISWFYASLVASVLAVGTHWRLWIRSWQDCSWLIALGVSTLTPQRGILINVQCSAYLTSGEPWLQCWSGCSVAFCVSVWAIKVWGMSVKWNSNQKCHVHK